MNIADPRRRSPWSTRTLVNKNSKFGNVSKRQLVAEQDSKAAMQCCKKYAASVSPSVIRPI
jgi:hypothetical protein